ncbi:MAG TPA: helix-turn-helix transcriptional regulator [Ignavibacteriales bacterium]|nr:helix-turn-helix transcriptional regulator [Ignavibacteriales bacterium]
MALENRLRKFRFEHKQITQEELANRLGVSRHTIMAIESGKFNPSVLLAIKIAKFFQSKVEDIFFIEEENKSGGLK